MMVINTQCYSKVNGTISAAIKLGWSATNATELAVAGQYAVTNKSFWKAKIDKALNLGVGKLKPYTNIFLFLIKKR